MKTRHFIAFLLFSLTSWAQFPVSITDTGFPVTTSGVTTNNMVPALRNKLDALPDTASRILARQVPSYLQALPFSGTDTYLKKFIVDIQIIGGNQISAVTGDTIHFETIRRNKSFAGPPAFTRSMVTLGKNGTRITTWFSDNYVEPSPDAYGNIYDVLTTTPESGQGGVRATIKVNWAALPVNTEYVYVSLRGKAMISQQVYAPQGLTAGPIKINLPSTAIPGRIYTTLNDIDPRNEFTTASAIRQDSVRQDALSLYADHFLRGPTNSTNFTLDTDVRFDNGFLRYPIYSPRNGDFVVGTTNTERTTVHATPSESISRTITLSGTNYFVKTISFTQKSTRASTGAGTTIRFLKIGDSTVFGLNTEIGVPNGYAHRAWGVVHEQWQKDRIDYLLRQGYTPAQIMSNAISASDTTKYRFVNIGTVTDPTALEKYTLNYRGVTASYTLESEGRGSWSYYMYINKPVLCQRSQGTWDLLGLGNGTGTDWVNSAAQQLLFDRTAWLQNTPKFTQPMKDWALANLSFTGTTLSDYITKFTDVGNDPVNPFYDSAKSSTITDTSGNVWTIRFSISKYLSRWRTMNDSGVRLASGNGAIGTKVGGNLATLDVTLPNYIVIQSCQNDGNVTHFGLMAKSLADAIKAEYAAQGWGIINIGLSVIDGAGTYFPKSYRSVPASQSVIDEFQRSVHDDNLQRLNAAVTNEDGNRIFVLANTFVIPTAKSLVWRAGNSVEYSLSQDPEYVFEIPSRTSVGIKAHINAEGHRPVGYQIYSWIKYTLGL
ncbi:hypothetical protein [Runella sp.]|uniref:hypothetical protein n=1 Tax=Runella sp. TaxID=1960881 RepID=UPI003D112D85